MSIPAAIKTLNGLLPSLSGQEAATTTKMIAILTARSADPDNETAVQRRNRLTKEGFALDELGQYVEASERFQEAARGMEKSTKTKAGLLREAAVYIEDVDPSKAATLFAEAAQVLEDIKAFPEALDVLHLAINCWTREEKKESSISALEKWIGRVRLAGDSEKHAPLISVAERNIRTIREN